MRSLSSYFIATVTLPANLLALVMPFAVIPVWAALATVGAEINGTKVAVEASTTLPVIAYLLLLSASWISGVNRNSYDSEIRLLLTASNQYKSILPSYSFILCFGMLCGSLAFIELATMSSQGIPCRLNISLLLLAEFAAIACFGCAIGQLVGKGVVAVAGIVLYSILLEPAVERLVPFITERGMGARIQEFQDGTLLMRDLLVDISFFVFITLLLFFLTWLIIGMRRSKNA